MTGPGEQPGAVDPLDAALAAAVRRTGAWLGGIYLVDPDESVLGLVALCGVPVDAFTPWWRSAFAPPGPLRDSIHDGRIIWLSSLEELARCYPRAAANLPYQTAFATAPFKRVRHCRGALLLAWPGDRAPLLSPRERRRIAFSARRIAHVLNQAVRPPAIPERPRFVSPRPEESTAQSAALAAGLVQRLPLGTLALDLAGHITYVNSAALELLGKPAEQLLGTQPSQSLPWLDNLTYMDAYRTALSSRENVALTVLGPSGQWLDLSLHADDSGTSILVTPHPSSKPAGAQLSTEAAASPESRIHLLMLLAAALTETVGVQDVVDLVADQVLPAFGAHGMIMSAADPDRIRIIGYRGYEPDVIEQLDGLPSHADLTPAGRTMATGVSLFFANREELAHLYPKAPQLTDKQAWAFLPLLSSGRPVGALLLAYNAPHRFSAAERSILTPLAGLIAQALDRARLYDAKHGFAHALQQTLLPHALPTVTGLDVAARYLPAGHDINLGGDFYDLIRLTDTTVAAVIGDVQGHDMSAAALMGLVRMAIHSHATAGAAPDQVLARTDRDLADLNASRFVSVLYAHLDLGRRQVTLASAGHPPPILRHPDNRSHAVAIHPGPPLGVGFGTQAYPLTTLPLVPGALLAFYTDGLVEIPGIDIAQTIADLADHVGQWGGLPLHQLVDRLVHRTRQASRHTDDIALLLLQPSLIAEL
ncbi:SpoIIE family protein phosphatase [Streptomyces phaeochromogenes]|uniref:SpoIIE family protein phosphatase n=1 Tax=Streptomyces phaeochromogenes TaxID=1923 RepID=UPI0033FAC5D4